MKILVSGADGQLARKIIKHSKSGGHELQTPGKKSLDITDSAVVSDVISAFRPDLVINCAAFNDVDGSEKDWKKAFMINGIGVRNLALACVKYGAALMHFSTDYVFDGKLDEPYTIAEKPNPLSRYAQSKLLGEELLKSHLERYFLVRTSWVFGNGNYSFPKKVIDWSSKKEVLRIVDDQISSPTYAEDLASAALKLAATDNYGLYHITNSGHCSRYEWVSFILEKINWKGRLEPAKSEEFNTIAKRPLFSALDNFPLSETTGITLPTWQDATERFLKDKR